MDNPVPDTFPRLEYGTKQQNPDNSNSTCLHGRAMKGSCTTTAIKEGFTNQNNNKRERGRGREGDQNCNKVNDKEKKIKCELQEGESGGSETDNEQNLKLRIIQMKRKGGGGGGCKVERGEEHKKIKFTIIELLLNKQYMLKNDNLSLLSYKDDYSIGTHMTTVATATVIPSNDRKNYSFIECHRQQ